MVNMSLVYENLVMAKDFNGRVDSAITHRIFNAVVKIIFNTGGVFIKEIMSVACLIHETLTSFSSVISFSTSTIDLRL